MTNVGLVGVCDVVWLSPAYAADEVDAVPSVPWVIMLLPVCGVKAASDEA